MRACSSVAQLSLLAGCLVLTACAGTVEEVETELPCDTSPWYPDTDGDGWGDARYPLFACQPLLGYGPQAGDCDDGDPAVHPNADELCDGLDNDCDGEIDEANAPHTCHVDADGDGYGDASASLPYLCELPPGCVEDNTDCDDADPSVHPGAAEILCDGIDSDCDGEGFPVRSVLDGTEYQSIQAAVDASAYGDTVQICPGTHLERVEIPDLSQLSLESFSGEASDTVLDGEVMDQILFAGSESVVTVSQLTFRNGAAISNDQLTGLWSHGGAILSCGETLVIEGCVFEDNVCWTQGGAVNLRNDPNSGCGSATQDLATLTVIDSVFDGNLTSDGNGGAIGMESARPGQISISGSEFRSNQVWSAGGAIEVLGGDGTELSIRDSVFEANESVGGGTVRVESEGALSLLLSETSFIDNVGGGLWSEAQGISELSVDSSVFDGNQLDYGGAAIAIYGDADGVVTIANSSFTDQASDSDGGSLRVSLDGTVEMAFTDSDFLRNAASSSGGAVYCDSGSATVTLGGCELADNTAGYDGGALALETPAGDLEMTDCDLTANSSGHYGGAIYTEQPLLAMDHVRLIDNVATSGAGGIHPDPDDVLTEIFLTDCTVNGSAVGGVFLGDDSVLYSENTDWGSGATDNDPYDIHTGDYEYSDFTTGESFTCESSGFCH
jgi:hypothetical protein